MSRKRSRTSSCLVFVAMLLAPASPAHGAPGDLDPSFSEDGRALPPSSPLVALGAMAVDSGGRAVLGWQDSFEVSRLRANGEPDPSFGTDGRARVVLPEDGWLHALALDQASRIVVAGSSSTDRETVMPVIARFRPDGSPDPGFGAGGTVQIDSLLHGYVDGVATGADGTTAAVGSVFVAGEEWEPFVVRLRPDGGLDPAFADNGIYRLGSSASSWPASIAVGPDGAITVGFAFPSGAPGDGMAVGALRLTPAGVPDVGFGAGGMTIVTDNAHTYTSVEIEPAPGGGILVAGTTNPPPADRGPGSDVFAALLRPDGSLDAGFGDGGYAFIDLGEDDRGFQVEPRVGGGWAVSGTGDRPYDFELAALSPSGELDRSFSGDGHVSTDITGARSMDFAGALGVAPDGRILVGGDAEGGTPRRPGRVNGPSIVRYLDSPGRRDADADGVRDDRDACPERWGGRPSGCLTFAVRRLRIRYLPKINDFRGSVFYAPAYRCSRGSVVKVFERRPGRDRLVGRSEKARTSRGTWSVSALAPPGRYYGRVVPRLVSDLGFCAAGSSVTINRP